MPRTIRTFTDAGQDREIDSIHARIDRIASQLAAGGAGAGSQQPVTIVQQVNAAQTARVVTANYGVTLTDWWIFVDATAGNVIVTLPPVASSSHQIGVEKTDVSGNTVTVTAAGTDKINGAATVVLAAQYASTFIAPDGGSNWGVF